MEKKFLDFIKKNKLLKKGDHVVVACSGGADSVALLVMLKNVSVALGISLVAVHVNHNIRGEEATRDENHVKELAERLGVDYVVRSVDAPLYAMEAKKTLEQAARELRYDALRSVKDELNATKIAVAHNKGDQTESVLMHLFRGSGISGVSGMLAKNVDIIRPLLDFDKAELIEYLNKNNISYKEDSTNSDINYSRNFIRHKIVGEVEKVYPGVSSNVCRFANKMQEINQFINDILPTHLILKKQNGVVVLNDASREHNVIVTRLIFVALEMINARVDVEEKHINQIISVFSLQVGKKIDLPNNLVATRVHEGVYLSRQEDELFVERKFKQEDKIETAIGVIEVTPEKEAKFGGDGLYIDGSLVPETAVWRNIKNGDKFTKFSGGTKTISKFLTDKKIDAPVRKKMVVLANNDEVLAVPGVEISKNVKISSVTKKIVKIELK